MKFDSWLKEVENELRKGGYKNPRQLLRRHYKEFSALFIENIQPSEIIPNYLNDILKIRKQEYIEKLKSQRASYADTVVYKGKTIKRCPKGTTRMGGTCAPKMPDPSATRKYKKPELPNTKRPRLKTEKYKNSKQIEKLSKSKTDKEASQARKYD